MSNVPMKVAGFGIEDGCTIEIPADDDKDVIILGIDTSKVHSEILLNTWTFSVGWYKKIVLAFSRLH